jgi:hypothetical protein
MDTKIIIRLIDQRLEELYQARTLLQHSDQFHSHDVAFLKQMGIGRPSEQTHSVRISGW